MRLVIYSYCLESGRNVRRVQHEATYSDMLVLWKLYGLLFVACKSVSWAVPLFKHIIDRFEQISYALVFIAAKVHHHISTVQSHAHPATDYIPI